MRYSIVIPIYNEADSIGPLFAELLLVMRSLNQSFEIIIVNDGSTDGSSRRLAELTPATIIHLRRNFGQTAAMDAGIKQSTGEYIITLDGDGQNPPGEIPKLIAEQARKDFDVVSGWRKNRQDPLQKRFVSRGANALRSIFVKDDIHDSGCSLKIYKRICFDEVDLFGEMHRFVPAILRWSGFTIGEVIVEHRPRIHGITKYSWQRIVKSFIDMLSIWFWRKYATRPVHLFGGVGVLMVGVGGVLGSSLVIAKIWWQISLGNSNLPLLAVLLVILGVQFFISGLLADIAIRHYYANGRKPYHIKKVNQQS